MPDPKAASVGAASSPYIYSMIRPAAVGDLIQETFEVGSVTDCGLIRRGFNDVYTATTRESRFIARVSHRRARGPANAAYEGALLSHLKDRRAPVAVARATKDGAFWRDIAYPEGPRALMLFEFAPGEPSTPTSAGHPTAHGASLARVHEAALDYAGPASRYRLDLDHLLRRPLAIILKAPSVDATMREALLDIVSDIEKRFAACEANLSSVHCHGDCHGGNGHVAPNPDGDLVATFFDFDDGGPGYLAYDIAVFLWAMEFRRDGGGDLEAWRDRWTEFLRGYRSVRPIPPADLAAAALFVSIRQFWLAGEYAARIPEWGADALSKSFLERQLKMLESWRSLSTAED